MEVWKYIAMLQKKIDDLYKTIHELQREIVTLRNDVNHNGEVFVKLQTVCDELRSDTEEFSQ